MSNNQQGHINNIYIKDSINNNNNKMNNSSLNK